MSRPIGDGRPSRRQDERSWSTSRSHDSRTHERARHGRRSACIEIEGGSPLRGEVDDRRREERGAAGAGRDAADRGRVRPRQRPRSRRHPTRWSRCCARSAPRSSSTATRTARPRPRREHHPHRRAARARRQDARLVPRRRPAAGPLRRDDRLHPRRLPARRAPGRRRRPRLPPDGRARSSSTEAASDRRPHRRPARRPHLHGLPEPHRHREPADGRHAGQRPDDDRQRRLRAGDRRASATC